ncbi:hypothetical protein CUMW_232430 [Citrus unshiu]|uniref:Disease resistance protein Roq1-like winged-helix domain-containing protein n=1 Tax=Citrus unshiu TaxID=55188 RepID=A0A2H5QI46_CITUN|nr:hypothetical protein CUMW_232430 [Citrus unshiu]
MPYIDLNFRRLGHMKVLIVFDDVTCFSQLESLMGSLDWLTPVSRIILTTRNKQVLRNWGVNAFKRNHPDVGYEKLSSNVMKYAQGVPLALKVLGEHVDPVMKFFNASGFYPEIGISVLVDKPLIAICSFKKIRMRDLLQELGGEIVRKESINPGNRDKKLRTSVWICQK